jgi:hypothetical protein
MQKFNIVSQKLILKKLRQYRQRIHFLQILEFILLNPGIKGRKNIREWLAKFIAALIGNYVEAR